MDGGKEKADEEVGGEETARQHRSDGGSLMCADEKTIGPPARRENGTCEV